MGTTGHDDCTGCKSVCLLKCLFVAADATCAGLRGLFELFRHVSILRVMVVTVRRFSRLAQNDILSHLTRTRANFAL